MKEMRLVVCAVLVIAFAQLHPADGNQSACACVCVGGYKPSAARYEAPGLV